MPDASFDWSRGNSVMPDASFDWSRGNSVMPDAEGNPVSSRIN